jgi:creatinine amidohydrolase/Fe(II)-dependent formamide hydrolase-like protein
MEGNITKHASRIHRLAELNTEQIRSLDRDRTAVLIPGGILEEHGPFLPCSTDTLSSERLTRDLADAIVRRPGWSVLIFPTIPLGHGGANGIGGKDVFPGSYTVRATTLRAVFMDLASELGEQGFRWIFYLNGHFPPNDHNRALHQACAYFSDVYGGKMVHLMGLIDFSILEGVLTAEDQKVAGMDVHAGALETSEMLAFHPDLVDPAYKQAATHTGQTWEETARMASAPDWPGYVGAPALAKASYGTALAEKINTAVIALALRILDGEDVGAAARNDRTPLQDLGWAGRKQHEWLQENGLE